VLGLTALGLALALALGQALDVVLLAFIALLLAVALATPAAALARWTRLPHWATLLAVALAILGAVGAGLYLLGEQIVAQAVAFAEDLPRILDRLRSFLEGLPGGDRIVERLDQTEPGDLASAEVVGQVGVALGTMMDVLVRIAFVLFLALFLAASPRRYRDGLVRLAPPRSRARARELADHVTVTIQGWILGQLASMLVVGALATIGLLVIGVPYALLLGLVAGLAELVPIFGPIFAFIPAVLVAFTVDPTMALWVAGLYLVIQQLEGNVIQPTVQRVAVDLPQALTVVAVLLGGALFGTLGYFVATPLMAIALVVVKMLYLRDTLGDAVELPADT
jgi:predicted PurR-regulated permease PerM